MKISRPILLLSGILAVFVFIGILNYMVASLIETETKILNPVAAVVPKLILSSLPTAPAAAGRPQYLRVERRVEGKNYVENTIIKDKVTIARFKISEGTIFDLSGEIPNGLVKFINEADKTYGFESYVQGKREGKVVEYFSNNKIKYESEYRNGRLLAQKSYSNDGKLLVEEDYNDTTFVSYQRSSFEYERIGTGKVYRGNGMVKFEWSVVDSAERNFTKAYDRRGDLVSAKYYNPDGVVVENWKKEPEIEPAVSDEVVSEEEVSE